MAGRRTRRKQNRNRGSNFRGGPNSMAVVPTSPAESRLRIRLGFAQGVTIVGGFLNPIDPTLLPIGDFARFQTMFENWRLTRASVSVRSQVSLATGTPQLSPPAAFNVKWAGPGASPTLPSTFASVMELGDSKVVNANAQSADSATIRYKDNNTLPNDELWNSTANTTSVFGSPFIFGFFPSSVAGADWLVYGWMEIEFRSLVLV